MMAQSKDIVDREPTELEGLLPFHAAGTLSAGDARRVETALASDPDLARQYAVIQDEYAETILLNESLGAPSARAMKKWFDAIDAEPARAPSASFDPVSRIGGFFAGLLGGARDHRAVTLVHVAHDRAALEPVRHAEHRDRVRNDRRLREDR